MIFELSFMYFTFLIEFLGKSVVEVVVEEFVHLIFMKNPAFLIIVKFARQIMKRRFSIFDLLSGLANKVFSGFGEKGQSLI